MIRAVILPPEGRSSILLVRAWLEGRPPALRVRITSLKNITVREHEVACVATVEDAARAVTRWLEQFEAGDAGVTGE